MRWGGFLFFDKFMLMGLHSVAYCCQRVMNSITFMHRQMGFWSINYLDDFGSAEKARKDWESYHSLGTLLRQIGASEADKKAVLPCTRMEFLSNLVDMQKMTIEISENRLNEIKMLLNHWIHKKNMNRKELESLIGKLSFVSNCVRPGRTFVARLINALKGMSRFGVYPVQEEMLLDIRWWVKFIQKFNGVSVLWLCDTLKVDIIMATDASKKAAGATCSNEYFHVQFPQHITDNYDNIAHLELIAIMIAVKKWASLITGKVVHLSCDNQACITIVNTGSKLR